MNQINGSGKRAAGRYDDLTYWEFNWRKGGGSARMIEISKREEFYQQEYCGCVYSLRDNQSASPRPGTRTDCAGHPVLRADGRAGQS